MTLKACVESYGHPQTGVVPYVEKIWNSLKYEVRNGEVKETIDATLNVLRAIARKLDGSKTQNLDASLLKNYIDLVFKDCRDDLANPTYTKQAGLLVVSVITATIHGYTLKSPALLDCLRLNFRQPKSPSHTKDLILILNSFLTSRLDLYKNRKQGHPEDEEQLKSEPQTQLESLFHDVYLGIWTTKSSEPGNENTEVLKQVLRGLALLVSQQVVQANGETALLCSRETCSAICTLLTQQLIKGLTLSSNDNAANDASLDEEAQLALRTVSANYTPAYREFSRRAKTEIRKRDWINASEYSSDSLRDILFRLAYVGCSGMPFDIPGGGTPSQPFSPLQHYITFTATLLDLFPLSSPDSPHGESLANSYVIAALHAGLLFFRDAFVDKYQSEALAPYSKSDESWVKEFKSLPDNWIHQLSTGEAVISPVGEDDPEAYRQFLKLSLFLVRHLYRAATTGPSNIWTGRTLSQIANIAALVVRGLDEQLQVSCNLAQEAFSFFSDDNAPIPNKGASHFELLTRGVVEGLWPGAMVELVCNNNLVLAHSTNRLVVRPWRQIRKLHVRCWQKCHVATQRSLCVP